MKKTSKIFGAVALSAALAMGTVVPAFAASEDFATSATPNPFKADNTADSVVSVYYNPAQLSATVPLTLTIVATNGDENTAEKIIAPTPDAYAITNTSETAKIQVAEISAEAKSGWALKATTNTPADGSKGILDLTLRAVGGTSEAPTYSDAVSITSASTTPATSFTSEQWQADKDQQIKLELSGTSKLHKDTIDAGKDALGEAVTITYKISKVTEG